MQKRAPTLANLLVIVVFVLACFGLLLFLWKSFGGPVPLKPNGYRIQIGFPNGLQLAEQSDVRISGVPVGRVVSVNQQDGRAVATLEMDSQYAPVPTSMHAILREKTLLGETFVQLVPHGARGGPSIPDGGRLPNSHVENAVTLDEVLSTFNPKTRAYFRAWQRSWANSYAGRGEDINSFFAALEPFVSNANRVVGLLVSQEAAVRALIHNTGRVFDALGGRVNQLEGLLTGGQRTFAAAAESSHQFAEAFRALPGFESSERTALKELDSFAADANPFYVQFRAAERQLAPTVRQLAAFAPPLQRMLVGLRGWTAASKRGMPAFERVLSLTEPVLGELPPLLRNLNPFLEYLGAYEPELEAFFANATAATQGQAGNETVDHGRGSPRQHYLQVMNVLGPESLAVYAQRVGTNRANPYFHPGAFSTLASGLEAFSSAACANSAPSVSGPPNETVSQVTLEQLLHPQLKEPSAETPVPGETPVANKPGAANRVPAPTCRQQPPFTSGGRSTQFPQVTP